MSTLYSKKIFAVFLMLVLSSSFLMSVLSADVAFDSLNVSKSGSKKGGRRGQKALTDYYADFVDIASMFGGDVVGDILNEMMDNLLHTADMLKSLAKEDVIDSINFTIRNTLQAITEAANTVAKKNNDSDIVKASDFAEITNHIQSILLKRCSKKANFSPLVLTQLEAAVPVLLQSLSEVYKNIVTTPMIKSFGVGLTFGLLTKGTAMLFLLERPEYVSADTFKTFADFPTEIKHQVETLFNQFIGQYDSSTIDMMFNMARMAATSFGNRRDEREHEHQEV